VSAGEAYRCNAPELRWTGPRRIGAAMAAVMTPMTSAEENPMDALPTSMNGISTPGR